LVEHLELAEQALTAGDYRTAQEIYERLLETPKRAIALQGLVKVFREEGRLDAARRLLEEEIAQNPDNISMLRAFAAVARDSGDRRSAIRGYALILSHDPDDHDAMVQLQRLAPSRVSASDRTSGTAVGGGPSRLAAERSPSSASTEPPRQPSDWRNLVGLVQEVDRRTEQAGAAIAGRVVINMAVRPHPRSSEKNNVVGVELTGLGIRGGDVRQGHWIEVDRQDRTATGSYVTRRVINLTTGAELKGRRFRL
jgi:ADP-ribose pyrophosphatase YjhB (NUDIX family)